MKFLGGISTLLLVAMGTSNIHAASNGTGTGTATCVPKAEMQIIAAAFSQFKNLANADYCYDGSQTSGLIEALEFMRTTQYPSSMPKSTDELFTGSIFNPTDWWGYYTQRISNLVVETSCPKGVGAFVFGAGTDTMYICPMVLTSSFSAVDRISVMMHEARHIDGYAHITCDKGPRAGLGGACDDKMSDNGSYAVTVQTYAQMGEYATMLHPALRAYAKASAVVYGDEAFESPAKIGRTGEFMLLTSKGEFYRLPADGSAKLTKMGNAPELGRIVMRARFMILFPDDKTHNARYVFTDNVGEIAQAAGDMANAYNTLTPQMRSTVAGNHIGAQWSAQIFNNKITFTCDPTSATTMDVALNFVPASTIYPNGYDRAAMSANIVTDSGAIMEFGCANKQGYVKTTNMKLDQNYKRVYKVGSEVLGLRADGRLFVLNGATSTALQTSVDGLVSEIAPNEDYQFFDN